MPLKKRRSPQEKKRLSYAKDRRNDYGQNDKAARKAIPARKRIANRIVRRAKSRDLAADPDGTEALRLAQTRKKWIKAPDLRLDQDVAKKLRHRACLECGGHRQLRETGDK